MQSELMSDIRIKFQNIGKCSDFGDEYYILNSWRQCQQIGIDPYIAGMPTYLDCDSMSRRLQSNSSLVEVATDVLQEAYRLSGNRKLVFSLVDADGYLLVVTGDAQAVYRHTGVNYVPGMYCGEKSIGTNCFSLVMQSGRPFGIIGMEHYCQRYHYVACSAAPIKSDTGKILGVVVLDELAGEAQQESLGVVGVLAQSIEIGLKMRQAQDQMRLQKIITESISDGLLSINAEGIITNINANGARILNLMTTNCIGQHIGAVVDFEPVVLNVLKTKQGYVEKEFCLPSKRGDLHFIKTAILLQDEQGELDGVVEIFREIKRVRRNLQQAARMASTFSLNDILGESAPVVQLRRLVKQVAPSDTTVLVMGESGTGKELLAQAIHQCSNRREGPFVAINCGAVPRDLMESELFGYEGGAFTGARAGGRPGKFELARGGTLLLDEIGEMPLDMQVKLLRVLQQKQVVRIGGSQLIPIDARIIAATNRNLWELVQAGQFREDLYYRINVVDITVPPLRERSGDIPLLIAHFLQQFAGRDGGCKAISPDAMNLLLSWQWPGNIRELENALKRACCLSGFSRIEAEHLPRSIQNSGRSQGQPGVLSLKEAERITIENAIHSTGGNVSQAAKVLGIGRNTLYDKLKEYAINHKIRDEVRSKIER